jgi:hypothetical protein
LGRKGDEQSKRRREWERVVPHDSSSAGTS